MTKGIKIRVKGTQAIGLIVKAGRYGEFAQLNHVAITQKESLLGNTQLRKLT